MQGHISGFSAYGEPGQGQYFKYNLGSHTTAEIAIAYVIKAVGEKH